MSQHALPVRIYINVFVALLFLTGLTTWVAFFDLGEWSNVVALSIAVLKASLVVLFFMHVRYSGKLTWTFVGAGIFWLLLLLGLTLSDFVSRGWLAAPKALPMIQVFLLR